MLSEALLQFSGTVLEFDLESDLTLTPILILFTQYFFN